MARLVGPDEASREVKTIVKNVFRAKVNRPVKLWADAAATIPADVLWLDGTPISDSTVIIDSFSMLPSPFLFPDGVDIIYGTCDGGPAWPIHAGTDERLDALAAQVAAVEGVTTELGDAATRDVGITAGTVAAGDDARLFNTRTPTAHAATHAPGGSDPMAVDAATSVGSLRTLGTGAQQAAAGNDARFGVEALPVTIGASWTGTVATSLANTARTVHATLTGNVTLTLPTPPATVSYTVTLVLTQDATGGRTLTLPQCKFAYGVAPVLSTAGGATDVLHLMWTGVLWIALMGAPAVA